jgi:hypothetical protein
MKCSYPGAGAGERRKASVEAVGAKLDPHLASGAGSGAGWDVLVKNLELKKSEKPLKVQEKADVIHQSVYWSILARAKK